MIHTSTSEVYGTARFVPITEEHPLQGQSPYSASKIGADQIALSFYTSFGTPVDHPAAVQHLRTAPIGARGDSDDHHADRGWQPANQARRSASDARFQLCVGHRSGFIAALGIRLQASAKSSMSAATSRSPSATLRERLPRLMGTEIEILSRCAAPAAREQ